MSIPYVDIAAQHAALRTELLQAAEAVLDHGQFVHGEEVQQFERAMADRCGTSHAVAVNSGTDALILSLRACGIGVGDEVITVPNSFVATAAAIAMTGARPVFVDVGDDYNMDSDLVEAAITDQTRAIMPVHLTGRPAAMDPILDIARRHNLRVIEDAAQAVGAEYRGRAVGGLGDTGCFSLHPLKTLNACGDGGVVTTSDPVIADKLRLLRNLGLADRNNASMWSSNSRLDTLQAAFLLVKMNRLDAWTEQRRAHAELYRKNLEKIDDVRIPKDDPESKAVYHTLVIQAQNRDALKQHLAERGVGTAIHYPIPIHLQDASRGLGYERGAFPVAERQADCLLSLPVFPELEDEDIRSVARYIAEFYAA